MICLHILRSRCLSFSDSPQSSAVLSSESSCLSFSVIPRQLALFGGWARLFCMPALSGSSGVRVKRMNSAQRIEGVYWVMCFDWAQSSALSASSFKPGVSGTWYIRWMQKPRLTIFRVAVIADSAPRRQQRLGRRYQNFTICDLPFLVSSLQPFLCHHFSQSMPRLAGCHRTCYSAWRNQACLLLSFISPL